MESPAVEPSSLWEPLRTRNFRLLWGGFVVSQIGDFAQVLAQSWLVVELTRSSLELGAVAFAQSVPRLAIGLLAGVIVDRFDRRRLLLITQSLAAVQSVVFLALVQTHRITYAWVLVLAFSLGVFDTLNLTARQATLPTLVRRALLPKAIALQALGVNVTQILGPSIGGLILAVAGVRGCLVFNALSFAALIASVAALRLDPSPAAGDPATVGDDLREALRYVRGRAGLWLPITLAWVVGFFGMPLIRQLPLHARIALNASESQLGMLAAAPGIGALAASVGITARASPAQLPRNILVAGVVFALAGAAFPQCGTLATACACLALFGGAQMAFRSAIITMVQLEAPDRMRGRLISALALDFALWSVGSVILGAVADNIARGFMASREAVAGSTPTNAELALGLGVALTVAAMVSGVVMAVAALPLLRLRATLAGDSGSSTGDPR